MFFCVFFGAYLTKKDRRLTSDLRSFRQSACQFCGGSLYRIMPVEQMKQFRSPVLLLLEYESHSLIFNLCFTLFRLREIHFRAAVLQLEPVFSLFPFALLFVFSDGGSDASVLLQCDGKFADGFADIETDAAHRRCGGLPCAEVFTVRILSAAGGEEKDHGAEHQNGQNPAHTVYIIILRVLYSTRRVL